jgi:hypothetical protein|tara:strand:- start:1330 stop:1743 length:414 start_codon:yes stop_codon:yes gene_type:complete
MGFKLGRGKGNDIRNGEIVNKMRFNPDATIVPGVDIIRKDLGDGIMGEANMDGSIYVSNLVEPGSKEERKVLIHEMRHATDMKIGKLKYEDDYVRYNGVEYERKDIEGQDMIHYDGKWIPAGSMDFPWELEANIGNK